MTRQSQAYEEPRIFTVSDKAGSWQVFRDAVAVGDFHSRGDAVRAACFSARAEEKHGRRAQVIASPGDSIMPHYEAHFGL